MKLSSIPHDLVATRARLIWEESGKPDGQASIHWLRAERELEYDAALVRSFSAEEDSRSEAISSPAFA